MADERPTAFTAVFFLHLSATTLATMQAWLDAGHRISAVVAYRQGRPSPLTSPRKWVTFQWRIVRMLRRHRIPLVEPESPLDWDRLRADLEAGKPDVAITYGFMRLVPQSVTSLFPLGALNFHPALLPYYRGPKPFHWLALDNAWRRHGGVTLHEMTGGFDEGPIVAQAAMADAGRVGDASGFLHDAMVRMVTEVVPRYCSGALRGWPQPPGSYPYARMDAPRPVVQPHWTRAQLASMCSVFRKRPGVTIEVSGKRVRLLAEARSLGRPTGARPSARLATVEFDLADGRVAYWRHTPLTKFLNEAVWRGGSADPPGQATPIRLGPFDRQDEAHEATAGGSGS
ncbi:formyltransferase family protein [Mesorhizobium sp. ZMM04-5]|uniref:Formyltransferase family protein n=1 Tax=Mesorhizobium marinum TaxID=3228790 RepID=A0ABV3QZQ1_9HYPH